MLSSSKQRTSSRCKLKKYDENKINYAHIIQSLAYFEDAEDENLPKVFIDYDWQKIKEYYIETTLVNPDNLGTQEQKTQILEEISRLNDRKYREEMNLSKVDSELEAMQERIYEEYSLTYNTCLEHKRPDFDIKEASIQINKLKKDISALGYVNVHAIEDVATLLDRYNDMSTQSADLKKAEEDLVKIIKDLSGEMLTKFNEEFEKINSSFKVVFRELFGGGNARLELTESEDPLLAGVEIMVQLPGKAANKLSLLSGGEKTLTAIALLFSILRLKPLPFSLLDEIEAALDDANIERFAQYLKKLSQTTQFIVITHRKPTMELADSLYGVTMEEKGVSKIVSVKLADAIKQAEQAN